MTWFWFTLFVLTFAWACFLHWIISEQAEDVARRGKALLRAEAENEQLRDDYESVVQDNLELGTELQALLNPDLEVWDDAACKRLLDAVRQMPADERADIEQWDREFGGGAA